ncbi:response regulator [Paraconexibacter antarcticus]|uniref:Response regulator n=1 Tax=Paraconexibacter antarcticus TaxID=2949664 RepID=A0ABY5DVD6_9ACTN|nr:response regulator [Paraconexibacter antarcticus]UTI65263.1 response regulator [Paraconexibacter antarcticus]
MSGPAGPLLLLVEDSAADARLVREALIENDMAVDLRVARDGHEALELLFGAGGGSASLTPDLILLDLNLPGVDGLHVLERLKADARLRQVPVVVLTTSAAARDVGAAYDLHANSYVVKPVDFFEFVDAMRSIQAFWLGLAQGPPPPARA